MKRNTLLASVLAASTVLAGGAYAFAADQVPPPPSAAQKALDSDALKLSSDGAAAFRDMRSVRVAIFNADPAQAKTLVGKAQAALAKAKTDESVFTKAEADLHPPKDAKTASMNAASTNTANASKAGTTAAGTATTAPPSSDAAKPMAWLPIDGQLTLGEDFVATPQKAAAVTDANKSIASGDQKGALEKLRVAGIDVNFTMAIAPLNSTIQDVDQAASLIGQGKYYEANAALKKAEDGVRFDVIDTVAVPQKAAAATPGAKDTQSAPPAAPAKPTP